MDETATLMRSAPTELAEVEFRLVAELSPPIPPDEVRRCIAQATAHFDAAPVRSFVPLLVERRVRKQLSRWRASFGPTEAEPELPAG